MKAYDDSGERPHAQEMTDVDLSTSQMYMLTLREQRARI